MVVMLTFDDSGNYLTGIFIVACGNTEYNVCTEGSYGIFNFKSGYIQVSGATIYSFYDNVHNYREGKNQYHK